MRVATPAPTTDGPPSPDARRARVRGAAQRAAQRVAFGAEVLVTGLGAFSAWQSRAAGTPVSRPAAIALGAGLVGLAASALAPRIRAYVHGRRARGA